jgi:UDP:flavonoid glycosyltransferase YjiC (YdhE family)
MVADELQKHGFEVRFSSFGEAAGYISMKGYQCTTVAPMEFAWSSEGGFSVKHSLANIPRWFTNFSRQVNQEARNISFHNPSVVVSDSRLSPIVGAKLLGTPSIVVLNQIKLLLSPRLRELAIARLFEDMIGELLGSLWSLADRILVPDLPPPFTISSHNIWNIGSAARRLEYIGFTSPRHDVTETRMEEVAANLGLARSRPLVYVLVSGPSQTRMVLVRLAIEAARLSDPKTQFVISEGNARGSPEPRKIGESVWYYEWCPVRDEIMALSDALVLRGGHVALSQAIQFGKPVLTVPIENHGEQLGNSRRIAELGMGRMLLPKGLGPKEMADSISELLGDPDYRKIAHEAQIQTRNLDGVANLARIVSSYLQS